MLHCLRRAGDIAPPCINRRRDVFGESINRFVSDIHYFL
jgi:hypothetical protein